MKTFRRTLFTIALVMTLICTALLISNYDPRNPTHRRYSSEPVLIAGDSNDIGLSGEKVLSKDLDLPRNDEETPRLMVCNTKYQNTSPPENNAKCIFYSDDIATYRIPDFVSDEIIAESKNRAVWNDSDLDQIRAFVTASKGLGRPLWVYVRHNTSVAPEYNELVELTGGRIVHYFATPNYVDLLDFNLLRLIAGGLLIMLVMVVLEMVAGIFSFRLSDPSNGKSSVVVYEHRSSKKAQNSVNDYDRFMRDANENARKTLDD